MSYSHFSANKLNAYKTKIELLLVTVTDVETKALHSAMLPLTPEDNIIVFAKGNLTYYVGMLGKYAVCHVESEMGSISAGGSLLTIQQSINDWDPKAIIMVGIAFGKDSEKQKVGDVIVSDMIIQYETKKVSSSQIEYRGPKQPSSTLLLNRFKNYSRGWVFTTSTGNISRIIVGNLLSGEVLIDNQQYRDEILEAFPTAEGGEMEGAGLASSAHSLQKPWIVVKSICDFADGNKAKNKIQNQIDAANAAVSLCQYIFENQFIFESLGINSVLINEKSSIQNITQALSIPKASPKKVLFNVYKKDYEDYYIARESDYDFNRFLSLDKSVWLYGKSGVGKTNLAFRNLTNVNRKFYVIDCSNCSGMAHDKIMTYIYIKLQSFQGVEINTESHPIHETIDLIISTIDEKFPEDACIIFEEMPIGPDEMTFAGFMFSIFIKLSSKNPDSKAVFVCTSLGDPKIIIENNFSKVVEKIKFINLLEWDKNHLDELCNTICNALDITLNHEELDTLVLESGGIPRFIKNFFWNFVALSSNKSFTQILTITRIEAQPYAR